MRLPFFIIELNPLQQRGFSIRRELLLIRADPNLAITLNEQRIKDRIAGVNQCREDVKNSEWLEWEKWHYDWLEGASLNLSDHVVVRKRKDANLEFIIQRIDRHVTGEKLTLCKKWLAAYNEARNYCFGYPEDIQNAQSFDDLAILHKRKCLPLTSLVDACHRFNLFDPEFLCELKDYKIVGIRSFRTHYRDNKTNFAKNEEYKKARMACIQDAEKSNWADWEKKHYFWKESDNGEIAEGIVRNHDDFRHKIADKIIKYMDDNPDKFEQCREWLLNYNISRNYVFLGSEHIDGMRSFDSVLSLFRGSCLPITYLVDACSERGIFDPGFSAELWNSDGPSFFQRMFYSKPDW